jgi:hypothetical protein
MGYKVTGPGDSRKKTSRELASSKTPRLGQAARQRDRKGQGRRTAQQGRISYSGEPSFDGCGHKIDVGFQP